RQRGRVVGDREAVPRGRGDRRSRRAAGPAGGIDRIAEVIVPTLTFRELAEMTGGAVVQNPDIVVSSVVIDSREVKPDSVFFAIKGDRLDGHQFVVQALQTARGAVVSRIEGSIPPDKGIVRVGDTTVA